MEKQKFNYPLSRKQETTDNYFGTVIADPYRWMEDLESDETKDWADRQISFTEDYFNKIPFRENIKNRLKEIWNHERFSVPIKAGEYYFFTKNDGLQNQAVLYRQKGISGEPELFLDPNTFSKDGTTAIKELNISADNRYLAYSVSSLGSDWEEIFVIEVATGKHLDDHVKWSKYCGPNWFKDGFFYGAYDMKGFENVYSQKNEYHKVYYHKLGASQKVDKIVYEDKTNPHRAHTIWSSEDEKYIFLRLNEYDKTGDALLYRNADSADGSFIPINMDMDKLCWCVGTIGDEAYLMTTIDAPNFKVATFDLSSPELGLKTLIPESNNTLNACRLFSDRLLLVYMEDAYDKICVHSIDGKFLNEIKLPGKGSVIGLNGRITDSEDFYMYSSYIHPPTIYRYNYLTNETGTFRIPTVKFAPDEYESKQIFFSSKDGTQIPMFIVHRKGIKMDGSSPTYLHGYGGFNVSIIPAFSDARMFLLESDIVLAFPTLRGGGEYGEKWHKAGMVFNKQNVFDDFIAAAEYLINEKYTSPKHLAIAGGSNGGLLVGAVMNQRPELFRVCMPAVGTHDMLRFQKFTIGASWVPELGSSDNEEQFKNILKYSPLHTIKEGTNYPSTFVTTADHDDRVVPSHSYKYAATLQEKQSGENPILIGITKNAGHGFGTPTEKLIEDYADSWTFLLNELGVKPNC